MDKRGVVIAKSHQGNYLISLPTFGDATNALIEANRIAARREFVDTSEVVKLKGRVWSVMKPKQPAYRELMNILELAKHAIKSGYWHEVQMGEVFSVPYNGMIELIEAIEAIESRED